MEVKDIDDKINNFSNASVDRIIEELSKKGIDIKEHR